MRARMFFFTVMAFFVLGTQSWAEDYLKILHLNEAYEIMGQKQSATEEIVETWLSGDMARMNTGPVSSVILRGDKQIMYMLNHDQKTYAEMPMNISDAMSGMMGEQGADEEMARMMTQMMGAMLKVKASVQDTGVMKNMKQWNCRVYEMTLEMPMGNTVSEICATEEIGVDMTLYHKVGHAMMAGQQGFAEMIQEMEKIKGVPVLTTSKASIMGATVTTREELLEHKKMAAPAGSFEIPEGYTKRGFMDM